jgi:hypothetical protein
MPGRVRVAQLGQRNVAPAFPGFGCMQLAGIGRCACLLCQLARLCRRRQLGLLDALQQGRCLVGMTFAQRGLRLMHQRLRRGIVRIKCGKALAGRLVNHTQR